MENMKLWNAVKQPPPDALKQIKGGRLSGMSDISPVWRYKVMTDQFGPCGVGWKFTVNRLWTEDATDGQRFAFASVSVYIRDGSQLDNTLPWSDPIPGIGGSMLIAQEKSGLHSSDEAYKMAVTDALGTALKMLGVAADVYSGKWDGAKYADEPQEPSYITTDQAIEIRDTMKELQADEGKFLAYIAKALKCTIKSVEYIPAQGYAIAQAAFKAKREAVK